MAGAVPASLSPGGSCHSHPTWSLLWWKVQVCVDTAACSESMRLDGKCVRAQPTCPPVAVLRMEGSCRPSRVPPRGICHELCRSVFKVGGSRGANPEHLPNTRARPGGRPQSPWKCRPHKEGKAADAGWLKLPWGAARPQRQKLCPVSRSRTPCTSAPPVNPCLDRCLRVLLRPHQATTRPGLRVCGARLPRR